MGKMPECDEKCAWLVDDGTGVRECSVAVIAEQVGHDGGNPWCATNHTRKVDE